MRTVRMSTSSTTAATTMRTMTTSARLTPGWPAILQAEGYKQSQILSSEGEKQSAILRAEGQREAQALNAEGQSKAIATVFKAIHDGDADPKLLAYQYLQMLPQIAQGESNKVWIIPSEFTQALGQLAQALPGQAGPPPRGEGDGAPPPPPPPPR